MNIAETKYGRLTIVALTLCAISFFFLAGTASHALAAQRDVAASTASTSDMDSSQTTDKALANLGLKVRAKLQHDGWIPTVASGKTAGSKSKQGLRMVKIKLASKNGGKSSVGSIRYKTYVPGAGWSKAVKNGKASGSNKRALTGVKIWLTGQAAKRYDVYYRIYMKGYGWLGWAKNKQIAGTKSTFWYANAIQVKLVRKGAKAPGNTIAHYVKNRWRALERKYLGKPKVKQILEVQYTGGTRATVVLRAKTGRSWKTVLSCQGYVGKAGIGQASAYSTRTPAGDFGITKAFGIKSNPGAKLPYVKVTDSMYWCGDRHYYNQLIDINKKPHDCEGEHLISIAPYYNYGLFFDYNTNPVRYGAGSAFFVHCTGRAKYTGGCVAVSESDMIKIIRNVSRGARLCIYPN